ncbi:MAG TPA: CRTAC1 family protein, partial [Blastocatellia bacterium]
VSLTGEKTITTPGSKVLGRDSFKGMGVDFGDLNGDGLLDIYVSNIAAEYALEESHFVWLSTGQTARMKEGVAPYIDSSEDLGLSRSGWGWDLRLVDFNNDGVLEALQATGFMNGEVNRWPELHELAMGNDQLLHNPESWPRFRPGDDLSGSGHNPFFVRAGDGRYYDLAQEVGLADIQVSRGIAIADVDGDGKLDFAVANQWEPSYLYHNQSPEQTSFLGLHLLLPLDATEMKVKRGHPEAGEKGRAAIGATATVYLPDGSKKVAEVDGGNGHSGKRSPDIHFGLGNISLETQIKVDLRWRDRSGQVNQRTLFVSPGWHTVLLGS